jgi:ubiquinol-cytochrome c reductase cytochrome b subunit
MCLGLARRDRDEAEHGRETGRIVMSPDGGYHEIREPVPAPRKPVAMAGSAGESARGS